jgi:hypothetical protein
MGCLFVVVDNCTKQTRRKIEIWRKNNWERRSLSDFSTPFFHLEKTEEGCHDNPHRSIFKCENTLNR